MEQALKPDAQGNVAVEPVADLIKRLTYRVNNPSAWDSFDDGASELIREAASSIASLSERLAAVITRLWPNGFGPQNIEELAVFIEEERRCDTEYRDELRAKLAEAREIIEPFAKQADAYDDDDQDHMADWPTFKVGHFRRARAFRDATSGAKS